MRLKNKKIHFYCNICCNDYDSFVICETWFNDSELDSGYSTKISRNDKKSIMGQRGRKGGGVLIYTSELRLIINNNPSPYRNEK